MLRTHELPCRSVSGPKRHFFVPSINWLVIMFLLFWLLFQELDLCFQNLAQPSQEVKVVANAKT